MFKIVHLISDIRDLKSGRGINLSLRQIQGKVKVRRTRRARRARKTRRARDKKGYVDDG